MPHAKFATLLGLCTIAWGDAGLTRCLLPDPQRPAGGGTETEPPPWIAAIVTRVQRHLAGEAQDFSDVSYDFTRVTEFVAEVLRATLAVKSGRTATYGDLAAAIGQPPAASRAVGTALGDNPWPLLIPCHRVVAGQWQDDRLLRPRRCCHESQAACA